MCESREWDAQQQWVVGKLLEPPFFTVLCVPVSRLMVPLGVSIDERTHTELLRESLQLTRGRGALREIHEMRLHASLGKEPKCFAGVRISFHAEDLNVDFHNRLGRRE